MKFVIFVEGHTERAILAEFFKRYLDPRLARPVGIKVVKFDGWRDYYGEIAKKVRLNLSGKAGGSVIAGVGLLDLYGPTFYPDDKRGVAERRAWAKDHIEREVDHPRFRQHFAVHETEAWLLAEPGILPQAVRSALPGKCANPESVNFNEPPARLLDRLYRSKFRRRYRKVIDGAQLFHELSPERARDRCPYLAELFDDMLRLARDAERTAR